MRRHKKSSKQIRCRVVARPGAALVFVLVLLLFFSMLGISLVRLSIAQHRQRLNDEFRVQAVRLAEAGWNRAVRNLALHADYSGEVWHVDGSSLGTKAAAAVRIEIKTTNDEPQKKLVITAEYPLGNPHISRVTKAGPIQPAN